jgi:hypothetical protein
VGASAGRGDSGGAFATTIGRGDSYPMTTPKTNPISTKPPKTAHPTSDPLVELS